MSELPTSLRIHTYAGLASGPKLLVLGAVHGNEICGTRGIERVIGELDRGELAITRGQVTFVPITNPLAYQRVQRMGERNLNRNLRPTDNPVDFEDCIANVLCPLIATHDVLLDLHSFHTPGEPFAMLGPQDNAGTLEPFTHAAQEEALALSVGARRIVEGWLDTYARGVAKRLDYASVNPDLRAQMLSTDASYGVGTTEYMRANGGYAVTLECGQHADPAAPEVAYQAIRRALGLLGLAELPKPERQREPEVLRLVEVIDRLHPDDQFITAWKSFDRVAAGEPIGRRHDGTIVSAPRDGFVVFPNPNSLPGNEWFYFAEPSTRQFA